MLPVDYAEVPVSGGFDANVGTFSSDRASPDELVGIADQIWQKVSKSGISPGDEAGNDKLLEAIQKEFVGFTASFPLVLRWMVQARRYRSGAFKKYLLKHASAQLDSREAFLRLQAEYLVLLAREGGGHGRAHLTEAEIGHYREAVVKQLLEEDAEFLEVQKQVEKDWETSQKKFDVERRQELYELLLRNSKKSTSS